MSPELLTKMMLINELSVLTPLINMLLNRLTQEPVILYTSTCERIRFSIVSTQHNENCLLIKMQTNYHTYVGGGPKQQIPAIL